MKILIVSPYLYEASLVEVKKEELEDFVREYLGELFPESFIRASDIQEVVNIINGGWESISIHVIDEETRVISAKRLVIYGKRFNHAVIFFDRDEFLGLLLVKV